MRILNCLVLCLALLLSTSAVAKNKTVRGYVSAIDSPNQFAIDDLHITCQVGKTKVIETHLATELQHECDPKLFYLGLEVEVSGELNDDQISATKIDIFQKKAPGESVVGTALLELTPQLTENNGNFEGTIFADGRVLTVESNSKLFFRDRAADIGDAKPVPLASADQVKPNVFITYGAKRGKGGSITLTKALFSPNYVDEGEQKLREEKDCEFLSGSVKVKHLGEMPIVNDEDLNRRVTEIGLGLVPEFQKKLPDDDPTKLHFRFILVNYKRPVVLAGANGTLLVSIRLLPRLQNEAQLAALLGYSIAAVVQKQEYRTKRTRDAANWVALASDAVLFWPIPGLGVGTAILNSVAYKQFISQYYEQAARLSLEYMLNAGWDIREAPTAYRLAYGKHHGETGNDTSAPMTGYLLGELGTSYSRVDFSKLRLDEYPYSQLALPAASKR